MSVAGCMPFETKRVIDVMEDGRAALLETVSDLKMRVSLTSKTKK
jgi:hypothetical protein